MSAADTFPSERAPNIIRYEDLLFDKVIGSGGFGEVWLGTFVPIGKKVAIKKLHANELSEEARAEIELHASLNNKFLLPFVGYTNAEPFCIVTEYISNGSLYDALHSADPQIHLSPTDLTVIAYCIASGMEYIHSRGIIHRDLKTLNILMDSQMLPKICDFGISSNQKAAPKNQDIGTAAIMAPELHRYEEFDQSVDVYSFGIILWEMLTGDVPFGDLEPMQIVYCVASKGERPLLPNDVPIPLMKLINQCWAEEPKLRPSFHEICTKFLNCEISFKKASMPAYRRFFENYNIAKLTQSFDFSPSTFSFPESSLIPPSSLNMKNPNLMGIQFEVQPMSTAEVIEAMSTPDHPRFEDALDYLEEHMSVVEEIGEKFWSIFLPLLLSTHYKALDRIANILVFAAKKRSLLKHIVSIPNPYTYLSTKSLELFLYVITFYPELIDGMFVIHLQVIFLKAQGIDKQHSLSLLCKIMHYSKKEELKSQIVEFLLSAADKFVDDPCGIVALRAIVSYKTDAIQSQDIVSLSLKYLNSSIPDNIITAYQALSCFQGLYKLPLPLVYQHIQRKEVAIVDLGIEAIRVSLHINDIEEVSRTVLALIDSYKATRNNRVVLLMCALADKNPDCDASPEQVFFQEAVSAELFSLPDYIASDFMPLLVLLFKVDPIFFRNHPLLPRFILSVLRYGDNEALSVLCSTMSHIAIDADVAASFENSGVIHILCLRMSNTKNSAVVEYCAALLKQLFVHSFSPNYLLVLRCLANQLPNVKNPAVNSIQTLELISRHKESLSALKGLDILQIIKKLSGINEISETAKILVKRLQ